ncbi:MAG: DUF3237 domain-containing protein [Actinomycetota bacterium]
MASDQLDAEFLFSLTAEIGETSYPIRKGPVGTRVVAEVTGGQFEGPKIRGTVVPPGGDWVYAQPDRTLRLDVRLQLVTDDGENILMTYQGIGTPTDDGLSVRTAPLFETGSETYDWLNRVQAVGIGESSGGSVTYRVYALA